jgi:hypothetical protein
MASSIHVGGAPAERAADQPCLGAINHLADSLFLGAMGAAEKRTTRFVTVAENAAAAMRAFRRQHMDRAFEAIEIVRDAILHDLQRLIVFVAATFTTGAAVKILLTLCHSLRRVFGHSLGLTILPEHRSICALNHKRNVRAVAGPDIGEFPVEDAVAISSPRLRRPFRFVHCGQSLGRADLAWVSHR